MTEPRRPRSSGSRPPLVDAGNRINNNTSHHGRSSNPSKSREADGPNTRSEGASVDTAHYDDADGTLAHRSQDQEPRARDQQPRHPRARAVQEAGPGKRASQASQNSTAPSSNRSSGCSYKTQIGPWRLGKTLGKGSSARVRLCKHRISGETAAVKIVPKKAAYLIQHGSLAALHQYDDSLPERINGEMRVPLSIEREVAILKLVDHPNVMKVYDIWENRAEIYLVLEFVDRGDLFDYINSKGRLPEKDAISYFRQIMSAMQYCHTFNICHRDLKPENILLTGKNQIKIADFGMAALHQSENHRLETACGSPHYAAPELLKNRQYRGDRADIWSMGVILFAMLAASLPFDDPDIRVLLAKTKRGLYEMPEFLSPEAKDLISKMLQTNPDTRITLQEMWRHPLIRKYNHLDDLGKDSGQPRDIRHGFHYAPLKPTEVDAHLVRQLRSLWHMYTEHQIKLLLMDSAQNDQKLFYWLLQNYRQKQLENFLPELAQSPSDYHHLHQPVWRKRVSTCEFSQPRAHGHGRSISKFTVISNVADDTDANTIKSYDPYNSSRPMRANSQVSHAKIVIHRKGQASRSSDRDSGYYPPSRTATRSTGRRGRANSQRTTGSAKFHSPHNSMSSLHSSRQGSTFTRPASRRKRGIDFTHVRKRSTEQGRSNANNTPQVHITAASDDGNARRPVKPFMHPGAVSKRRAAVVERTGPKLKILEPEDPHAIVNEQVRHFSNSIAKDCDDAFNSSMIESDISELPMDEKVSGRRDSARFSFSTGAPSLVSPTTPQSPQHAQQWDARPLPPLPTESPTAAAATVHSQTDRRDRPRDGMGKVLHQVNRLALPVLLPKHDRRVMSAPAYGHAKGHETLPSISENGRNAGLPRHLEGADRTRIVSAPPPRTPGQQADAEGLDYLSRVGDTIRVVNSPTTMSPVPRPLNVRKKHAGAQQHGIESFVSDADFAYMHGAIPEGVGYTASITSPGGDAMRKKKSSWFKRSSKDSLHRASYASTDKRTDTHGSRDSRPSTMTTQTTMETAHGDMESTAEQSLLPNQAAGKKKAFGFLFWKNGKQESRMSIAGPEYEDSPSPERIRPASGVATRHSQRSWSESESGVRTIEVHQNWLARLFGVKPATSHMCLVLSRKRARQEIVIVLKDWRQYGIRDVQVDKERNIVFARVGSDNYLNIKEVSFAIEIMTVIEHGKRGALSIARFTQERGAASSFHKVVDTLKTVFGSRNLVVTDKRKSKMMIKTLNS